LSTAGIRTGSGPFDVRRTIEERRPPRG
jgi:hypothetical protein